jgi:Protein of unknown function DUF86.
MKLKSQLDEVEKYFKEFGASLSRFLEGRESKYAVERLLELLSTSLLELASIILIREKGEKPNSYDELINHLCAKANIGDERDFLRNLIGLRSSLINDPEGLTLEMEINIFRETLKEIPKVINKLKNVIGNDPSLFDLKGKLKGIFEKWGVKYAIAYGNLALKGNSEFLEICIKAKFTGRELGVFLVEIADSLGVSLENLKVCIIDQVSPSTLKRVMDEGEIIFGEEAALEDLKEKYIALLDYFETVKGK